jgi:hypothetical protein
MLCANANYTKLYTPYGRKVTKGCTPCGRISLQKLTVPMVYIIKVAHRLHGLPRRDGNSHS